MSDIEKKTFMNRFIKDVIIYPERSDDRRIIKSLRFKFPIFYDGKVRKDINWDSNSNYECVACLERK